MIDCGTSGRTDSVGSMSVSAGSVGCSKTIDEVSSIDVEGLVGGLWGVSTGGVSLLEVSMNRKLVVDAGPSEERGEVSEALPSITALEEGA